VQSKTNCDLAIVGGGLAGGLIALALKHHRPELDVRVIEGDARLGGNHVWSFFDTDIAPEDRAIVEPLIGWSWQDYDIVFPAHSRTLEATYNSIDSEHFDAVVRAALTPDQVIKARAVSVSATRITLDDQRVVEAKGVIDASGVGDFSHLSAGWQKFVGQLLVLDRPHGLTRPIVMDASVEQLDGYRFVYCLPFSETEVFVEDTYYSDTSDLDVAAVSARVTEYAKAKGWHPARVERVESGVLPVTMGGDFAAYWASTGEDVAKAGMRSGLFHPTTGYSLPDAVRLASLIARAPDLSGSALQKLTHDYAQTQWRDRGYYRMLDKMLFHAADPDQRYRVLERFYRLAPNLIRRFYAGQSTWGDKLRILSGKPPVPIGRAVAALLRRTK
jgi:lycopene beta-cyclase